MYKKKLNHQQESLQPLIGMEENVESMYPTNHPPIPIPPFLSFSHGSSLKTPINFKEEEEQGVEPATLATHFR